MEQLLKAIRYNDGKFPRNEIQQIIERKEEAIPCLLQIMNDLKEDYTKVIDSPTRIDFIYSYYLLAQFRVKELFPIMIDILSSPSAKCEEIFGDAITEDMGRILASVYNGEIGLLQRLIENTRANQYARGQALIAMVTLVFDGQLSREFVMDYLKELMNERHEEISYYLNAEIVCSCDDLYPEEVYTDIQRLYDDQVVEAFVIGMNSIDRTLKQTKEAVLQKNQQAYKFQLITDTIKELQGWYCFRRDNEFKQTESPYSKKERKAIYGEPKKNPAVKAEKIGRNDPCTCGSGQKYKKCCGK